MLLLGRLSSSSTPKFSQGFLRFICFAVGIPKSNLGPDVIITALDACQGPGLFAQVLPVLLPNVQKAPTRDRKIIAVGLATLLSDSSKMMEQPTVAVW